MATPYELIQKGLHSRIKRRSELLPELEEQYLLNALGDYELELRPLTYIPYEKPEPPTEEIPDPTDTEEPEVPEEVIEEPVEPESPVEEEEEEFIFGIIEETLTRPEINLLAMLMYKHYLAHKIDEVLQLQNIIGKDISLTGMGQNKQEYNRKYVQLMKEIDNAMSGLKDSTYSFDD